MISISRKRKVREKPDIGLAPMIDMVFILLIFLLVTTSFVKDTGVEVTTPTADSAEVKDAAAIRIGITSSGTVHVESKQIAVSNLRGYVAGKLAGETRTSVLIIADREAPGGVIVDVIDECRLAGATDVALFADKE
ncbi:MAG: biopolymer transporter ExbD [Planctomycetes bacterium]|nr:biopolymer transporter ExbD [Planctomycetota bacterium]